jgi:uncharacterized protein YqjF (DUF2071 family)
MPRVFLRAEWRNLIIVSYLVPPALLERSLPRGLELDLFDGKPAASLVAFEFRSTRVWGVPWPGFVNFPEWNLRFYVKTKASAEFRVPSAESKPEASAHSAPGTPHSALPHPRRGVVFIREFVPNRVVSQLARRLYNEPYAAAPMRFEIDRVQAASAHSALGTPHSALPFRATCTVDFNHARHTLAATASPTLHTPHDAATEHLLKEHQWGFGRTRDGRTLMYEVVHPTWRIHQQASVRVDVDWARLYGPEWGVMQDAEPFSAILAEGSAITVSTATTL